MLPLTVLRRLDCVLEPTKDKVLAKLNALKGGSGKTGHQSRTNVVSVKSTPPLRPNSSF